MIRHHMLHGVYYTADLDLGDDSGDPTNRTVNSHEGSNVTLHGTSTVSESGVWNRSVALVPRNELTSTGVVHELKDVMLPSSLTVMIGDLALAAKGETMISLVKRAGLGKLLNGTLTPGDIDELDDWRRMHPRKEHRRLFDWPFLHWPSGSSASKEDEYRDDSTPVGWTLLCPKDSAFNSINLTRLLSDAPALRRLVLQHIIPMPPPSPSPINEQLAPEFPLSFADSTTYSTLLSPNSLRADIVFRRTSSTPLTNSRLKPIPVPEKEEILIGIRGARGGDGTTDVARVLNYGRTTAPAFLPPPSTYSGPQPRSGVIQIDRLIQPYRPDWWNAWGWAVAFGAVGSLAIVAFWAGVLRMWHRVNEEATYEPIGDGAGEGEEEEYEE